MRILIVGGGIAGVTLAHLLEKEHEVLLIEKGSCWRTIGFGVGIWKNGLDILKKLPLPADFWDKKGYPVLDGATIAKDGSRLIESSFATPNRDSESMVLVFEREYLLNSLVKLLKNTVVRFNTTVLSLKNLSSSVEVGFNNGEKSFFDLVVGADGIRSSIRNMVFGEKLVPYGWNIWGMWVSQENGPFHGYYVFSGKNETLLGFPFFDKHLIGMMYKSKIGGKPPQDHAAILKQFPVLGSRMEKMVRAIDNPSQIFNDTLGHVEMKEWYKGQVVIIGDARHGMSPLTGMGTSLALEDAWVLAEEVKHSKDVDAALASFVQRRNKRLKSIRIFKWVLEFIGTIENVFAEKIRNIVLRMLPSSFPVILLERIFKTKI